MDKALIWLGMPEKTLRRQCTCSCLWEMYLQKPFLVGCFRVPKLQRNFWKKKKKKADFQQNISISKHFAVKEMVWATSSSSHVFTKSPWTMMISLCSLLSINSIISMHYAPTRGSFRAVPPPGCSSVPLCTPGRHLQGDPGRLGLNFHPSFPSTLHRVFHRRSR